MNAPLPWLAPTRDTPVDAQVLVPGSKSLTNRALVLAALADGPSTLTRPLGSRDTQLMAAALTSLGAQVEKDGMTWRVTPLDRTSTAPVSVDCGLAGTVMRFVPPLAALRSAPATFDGDPHARRRPMGQTIATLRALGVEVDDEGRGALPFVVRGTGVVEGGPLEVDASASSQFVSALLLAAPAFANGLDLRHVGATLWRALVEAFGGSVERDGADLVFHGGSSIQGVDLDLHDVGELTPVVAALAALADGPSRLRGVAHLRGHETDRLAALATELNRLGGDVTETEDGLEIRPRPLHGAIFETYDDHRMAHAAVVLALRVPELFVENVSTTVKTYPNFAPVWERLVA